MSDPTRWAVRAAAARLERREIGARALTEAYLARIDQFDGAINAYVTVTADAALRAADAADSRARRLGPLDGVPVAIKDNIDLAGSPTGNGLGPAAATWPTTDAAVVERLKTAGAVILGKLNMHEAALGATSDNPHHGAVHNPWRHGYTPGGSSGGSGAAVAARLCAAALGTDTMGSVRLPAAYCGVSGLKPTACLIGKQGVARLCEHLDQVGPLARSADDLRLLLEALADPAQLGVAPLSGPEGGLAGMRLGVVTAMLESAADDVRAACQRALALAAESGAEVVPIELAGYDPGRARRAGLLICESEGSLHHGHALDTASSALSPALRKMLLYGRNADARRITQAWRELESAARALHDALGPVDFVVCPTTPQCAFPFDQPAPSNQADFTAPASFAACPSVSLPCGTGEDGLPVGVQLIARAFEDRSLLDVSLALERLLDFQLPDLPATADQNRIAGAIEEDSG